MSMGVRSVIFDIIGKDNASRAFRSASKSADLAATRLERNVGRIYASGAKLQGAGQKLSKAITLPIVAAAAVSVHEAAKYQKALNTIQVATDKTDAQMRQASAGIKRIAVETGTNLTKVTDSFYVAAKGGYTIAKSLEIARVAAQGAKAENADLAVVTNALTSVLASYGNQIKSPVAGMNMIIRGAGLAKTTIQDFSASLSNVVPVAASLHISFADIAAAIATMTQHGETAQHATENLRNLVSNLAGQNNVASQAMQQLGINTVDLRKKLGERGLVKTLDLVIAAANKATGKDGLIHIDNMKAAKLATHSLNQMLGEMNGKLKQQSLALLSGKTGITDYRKYVRSLGGQLGPMGTQFLSLYLNTKGFSNLIKSGKGNVLTYASALQMMLGGLTGMNVSLQVTGQSAKTFHNDAKSVGDAAAHAGRNVIGWDKTQRLFTTRLDVTKAKIQVLAVTIGTALIPYVEKVVGWVQKAVDWFSNLSGTSKSVVKWALIIGVVLGPVLAIFGRLIRLFATFARIVIGSSRFMAGMAGMTRSMEVMGAGAYKSGVRVRGALRGQATEAELTAAAMQRSAGRVAAAEAGQARAVVASTERQMSAMTALRATMGAPLVGGLGRGTGIVPAVPGGKLPRSGGTRLLAGGAGLAFMIGGQYLGDAISGKSKKGSARNIAGTGIADAATGAFIGSLIAPGLGTAIGGGVGALIGILRGAGDGKTHQERGIDAINKALKALPAPTRDALKANPTFAKGSKVVVQNGALGTRVSFVRNVPKEKDVKISKAMVEAALRNAQADRVATAAGNAWADSIVRAGKASQQTATDVASAVLAHTDLVKAGQKVGFTEKDLTNAITGTNQQYERTVAFWKQFGKPTAAQIQELAKLRDAWKGSGKAAEATAMKEGLTLASMRRQGTVADLLRGKLVNLNRLHLTASQASSVYRHGLLDLTSAIEANGATLDHNTIFGQRNAVAIKKAAALALVHAQAVYTQTGSLKKSQRALAEDRKWIEYVGTAAGLKKPDVDALLTSLGLIAKSRPHAKVSVDTVTALNDAKTIQSYIDSIHGHQVFVTVTRTQHANDANPGTRGDGQVTVGPPNAKGTANLPNGYFTVGEQGWELGYRHGNKVTIYDNKTSQKMTGHGARLPGFAKGTKHATAATKAAKAHNDNVKTLMDAASPFLAAGHNVNASASELADAAKALRDAAKEVKLSSKMQAKLAAQSARLSKLATRRDRVNELLGTPPTRTTAYDRLGTAQDNYSGSVSSTRSTFTGMVDATSIGQNSWGVANSSRIVAQLKTMVAKSKRFADVLKKLIKLRVPQGIVEQLASAGPSALAQAEAFAASSPADLASIRSSYAAIDTAGKSAGKAVADAYYGGEVKRAQAAVNRLVKERDKLNKAIRYYVDDMVREVEKLEGIKLSPSIAKDDAARHHKHGHPVTRKGDGGHRREIVINVNGVSDPHAAALAVARRLSHTVA